MSDINELGIDEQLRRGTTRRTIVTTGAKLAYAAPLVAASATLSGSGALAACGGATPFPLTVDGQMVCCGCCPQTRSKAHTRQARQATTDPLFTACQAELARQGITCPVAGQPGSNVQRVCVAQNINISPPQ